MVIGSTMYAFLINLLIRNRCYPSQKRMLSYSFCLIYYATAQNQKPVSAYFTSKQMQHFSFAQNAVYWGML